MARSHHLTIAGRNITLTRPEGKTQGWEVRIGRHFAGVLDWDNPTDRTWFIDLSTAGRRQLGLPTRRSRIVICRGISREQALRAILLFYGWGNDAELDRIADRDPGAFNVLFAEAVAELGDEDDDAIADHVVARYPAYRRQQLTALYTTAVAA